MFKEDEKYEEKRISHFQQQCLSVSLFSLIQLIDFVEKNNMKLSNVNNARI